MIRRLFMAVVLINLCLFAAPLRATAFDIFGNVCRGDQANSAVCTSKTSQDPIAGNNGVLAKITNIVAIIGGAAAVIVLIVSAIRLITSGSDVSTGSRTDTDVENARRGIANALIGLAIIVLSRSIILFLLKRL